MFLHPKLTWICQKDTWSPKKKICHRCMRLHCALVVPSHQLYKIRRNYDDKWDTIEYRNTCDPYICSVQIWLKVHFWSVAKVALRFGCAKQSKNLERYLLYTDPKEHNLFRRACLGLLVSQGHLKMWSRRLYDPMMAHFLKG